MFSIDEVLRSPATVQDPYSPYKEFREKSPVVWSEELGGFAVFGYQDCCDVLGNDGDFSAERMEHILVRKTGRVLQPDNIYRTFTENVMMYTGGKRHEALRRSTGDAFTSEAMAYYARVIEERASHLIRSIPAGASEIDAMDLAVQMPVEVAVHVFGVPEGDLDYIRPKVDDLMTYWSGAQAQPLPFELLLEHLTALHAYVEELLADPSGVTPHTVIARLVESEARKRNATYEQTVHQLVLVLMALFAPTTPGTIGSGLMEFAIHPRQVELFLQNPEYAANAGPEVLRMNASNQYTPRIALASIGLGGVRIKEGDVVFLFLGSANRDARIFPNPDAFDLTRSNSRLHLSFGAGTHGCLARQIVLSELKSFFGVFFDRFSEIRIAREVTWDTNLEFRRPASVPLNVVQR